MILSNLFTAFLSIASVSASQSFGASNFDGINEPSKRGETLPRDGGFFNLGSVPSVSTNAGIYENFGCFEDGVRGKPLASPLLNLTGAPAETIQSCVNACSISGQDGIPYTYAGIEPGSCWCSNYIFILAVRSSPFCLSSCPSTSGKYCGGTVNGILYMQIYELKQGSGNFNPTSTTSVTTSACSSLISSIESSSLMPQSESTTSTLTVSEPPTETSSSATSPAPDFEVPPNPESKAKPKGKLHRRQLGPIPENFLEPPGRPDFIKEFPEKNTNKPFPPPFDRLKDPIDPATGKKIPPKKPRYSHSKISLRKRPSLKDIGLLQDGRVAESLDQTKNANDNEEIKRKAKWKKIIEKKYENKLRLQGSPKAYMEMEETMTRSRRKGQAKDVMEEWEKRIFMGLGRGKAEGGDGNREEVVVDPTLREDAIINRVLLGEGDRDEGDEEEDGEEGEEEEDGRIWRKWGGQKWSGGKREGGKIHLERK